MPESLILLLHTVAGNTGEVQQDHVGWRRLTCWWRTWSIEVSTGSVVLPDDDDNNNNNNNNQLQLGCYPVAVVI